MMLCSTDLLARTDVKSSFLEISYSTGFAPGFALIYTFDFYFYILSKAFSKFLEAVFSTDTW